MREMILPRLSSKSTTGYAKFSEYLIEQNRPEQLLEDHSMAFSQLWSSWYD